MLRQSVMVVSLTETNENDTCSDDNDDSSVSTLAHNIRLQTSA